MTLTTFNLSDGIYDIDDIQSFLKTLMTFNLSDDIFDIDGM